jgi:hypothetical protein
VNPKQFFPWTGEWKCLWKSLSLLLNFWDFLKTHGCMMDFQQASRVSECRQGKGFGAGQCACDCCPCVQASGRKMRKNQECFLRLGISLLGALVLSPALLGQASPDSAAAKPVVTDWSSHHLIFSKPASAGQTQRVEPLRAASSGGKSGINRDWSQDLGTAATVGATNFPAKFSFQGTNATCAGGPTQPDFVVYPTGLQGSPTQANIVAYTNLYSGCSGTVPTVYWAYNVSDSTITTSPVMSDDGTQISWVQTDPAGQGILILLKWAASSGETVGSPLTVPNVVHTAYPTCTAPCWTSFALAFMATIHGDSNSSVFYDYSNDTAYVGDDFGVLHKLTPFFKGLPAEIRTGGWPVQLNPGSPTPLNSPVHDYGSGNVFVTDTGGFLYLVDPTAGVTQSGQLDFSLANDGGPGIVQGPIVDSTDGLVYAFAPSDGSGTCVGGSDCAVVYQLTTSFVAGDTGSAAVVGASTVEPTVPSPLYAGAFDSAYETSGNATGNLYVCGNTGGDPILYQVAITAGAMNSLSTAGPVLSTSFSVTPCSPVTDILNPNASGGATEWMFASVQNGGSATGCAAGGCIFNFIDTPWKPLTVYAVGQEVLDNHFQIQVVSVGGTSGAHAPGWSIQVGHSTTDGTVHWLDQGVQSAFTLPVWSANHTYSKGTKILDTVHNNVQLVTTAGKSGGTMPSFNTTAGGTTTDGTSVPVLTWTNIGALGTANMPAAGGTSGIIVDNTVGSGTLAGASQVYFSTLSGGCGAGTDGCAVQASQSGLH